MEGQRVRYRSLIADSARWDGFEFRDGDIVISTPAKCGTTWTQQICALLIFQTTQFHAPVDLISPWLEQSLRPLDDVVSDLEGQTHRRFIKSHTPLDGLPWDERVTYITVGRDPRDVAMSSQHHLDNIDFDVLLKLREEAVGNGDLAELMPEGMVAPADTPIGRFWQWVDDVIPKEQSVMSLSAMLHHLDTFWRERDRSNVVLLHYDDLKADLEGQMRALAHELGIAVPDGLWSELVEAATFETMKSRAADAAPNASEPIWRDTTSFFHRGTTGQWRDVLGDDDLVRYEQRVNELISPELSGWVHQGPIR